MDEYIKTSTQDTYVKTDGKVALLLNKEEVKKQLEFFQTQLASLPATPTDKELLAWAKENYPQSDVERSRTAIKAEIAQLQTDLEAIK